MMFFRRAKQDKQKAKAEAAASGAENGKSDGSSPSEANGAEAELQFKVDPESLGFKTTADVELPQEPVGQAKALKSLAFGISMRGPSYNILVTEPEGTLCRQIVRASLEDAARKDDRPADWVYVDSFDVNGGYRALKLPAGTAKSFAEAIALALDRLADALPAAFAADDYELKRRTIEEEFRLGREDALETLRREAESQNIAVLRTPSGIAVAPILEGKVVKTDVFNSVPESLRQEVRTKIAALEAEIEALLAERPEAERARRERLIALNEQVAGRHVRAALEDAGREHSDAHGVESYLKAAGRDLTRNAGLFLALSGQERVRMAVGTIGDTRFARYRVHTMATSSARLDAPVVDERNPTYANLFGRIEFGPAGEGRANEVTRIRPGALHRANGGYLMLDAGALASAPDVAEALARALEAGEIRFDPPVDPLGSGNGPVPELEPIPLSIKLVILGERQAQEKLAKACPQLKRHFKVDAVFDDVVERSDESITAYARLIAGIVSKNELKPLDASGVALLIDEASRKAGGNGKLSLEFSHIIDLCREADHWAGGEGRLVTSADDIKRALKERKERGITGEASAS